MVLLTLKECEELIGLFRQVFRFIQDLKKDSPLANDIKFPGVPARLSESLAYHFISHALVLSHLEEAELDVKSGPDDIVAHCGDEVIRIEIKATGLQGFQKLRDRAISSEYIVWLHFNNYFESPDDVALEVHTIKAPGKFFSVHDRVNVKDLEKKVPQSHLEKIELSLGKFFEKNKD